MIGEIFDTKTPAGSPDTQLTQDVLIHALAFRGMSNELFQDAVVEIEGLTADRNAIFPPHEFPSWREPKRGTTLKIEPESDFTGRLSPAEAVAVKVLQVESLALLQSHGVSFDQSRKIDEILGTGVDAWQSDAIEALVSFNHMVAMVSGVRERIRSGLGKPSRNTIGDIAKLSWYEFFEEPLRKDGLRIGENVALRIVEKIKEFAERDIPTNPGGARGELEMKARIAGSVKGAELARDLFLETVELASHRVSAELDNDLDRHSQDIRGYSTTISPQPKQAPMLELGSQPKESEVALTEVTFLWLSARKAILDFLSLRIGRDYADMLYDLGHAGRSFEDFPEMIVLSLELIDNKAGAGNFFKELVDVIEKYVKTRVDHPQINEEIRGFILEMMTRDDRAVNGREFDLFVKNLRVQYKDDQEKRLELIRSNQTHAVYPLVEIIVTLGLIKASIKGGSFNKYSVDTELLNSKPDLAFKVN